MDRGTGYTIAAIIIGIVAAYFVIQLLLLAF